MRLRRVHYYGPLATLLMVAMFVDIIFRCVRPSSHRARRRDPAESP